MEKNYLLCIEYDGTKYSGWQRQGNTDNTIECRIANCLKLMCNCKTDIELHGSGRTDAGVHAKGQMANVRLDTAYDTEYIKEYLNKYLPADIRILEVKIVDNRFHARLSAKSKTYKYTIFNGDKPDVFIRRYCWQIKEELDVEYMQTVANSFAGKHDFRSFSDMRTKKSSIRNIDRITICKNNDIIYIEFTGDGFLYHMVRKLTAAIVEAGRGRLNIKDVQDILDKKDRQSFALLAPANGLCLEKVKYTD